jgi:hypothetical protein
MNNKDNEVYITSKEVCEILAFLIASRNILVGVVMDSRGSMVRFPTKQKTVLQIKTGSGTNSPSYSMGSGAFPRMVTRPMREACHITTWGGVKNA